jgi:hypothetical protein
MMKCNIPSERLAAVAFGLMAVLIVSVFALMATMGNNNNNNSAGSALQSSISSNSNCGLVRSGVTGDSPTAFLEGVGYNKLRSAVIQLYHASDPETTDIDDQFDDALVAMSLVERDGHPVPIDGVDGLYVGSVGE